MLFAILEEMDGFVSDTIMTFFILAQEAPSHNRMKRDARHHLKTSKDPNFFAKFERLSKELLIVQFSLPEGCEWS
jgi:hypothetical protein